MWSKIAVAGIKLFKNKKLRRVILIAIGITFFLLLSAPFATGLYAFSALGSIAESITDFFNKSGYTISAEDLDADKIIEAFGNGYLLSEEQAAGLRMSTEDFRYMLERVSEYNHAGERKREITIEAQREYSETVTDDEGNVHSYSVTESVPRTITVDNSYYEGLAEYDYQLLYYFCLAASLDRSTSGPVLAGITPLDKDFMPITSWDDTKKDDSNSLLHDMGYFITREDIDRVFTYTSMHYDYYFDVLRDGRANYSYFECMTLPHVEVKEGDTTFYYPRSYLISAKSSYSHIENIKSHSGTVLAGTKEVFSKESIDTTAKSLFKDFTWKYMTDAFKLFPGGEKLTQKYEEWGAVDKIIASTSGLNIRIESSWDKVIGSRILFNGTYSTIGEAAVAWAYDRSCQSHCRNRFPYSDGKTWQYDQSRRNGEGFVDCSSLVYRAYSSVGLLWPTSYGSTNTYFFFYKLFSDHPEMVIGEKIRGYSIDESDLKPGDVILISSDSGWATSDNHIIMYMGSGYVVHAKSKTNESGGNDGHVHVQLLSDFNETFNTRYDYIVARPYIGLGTIGSFSTYVPTISASGLTGEKLYELVRNASAKEKAEICLYFSLKDSRESGIIPSVTAAQMMLESGMLGTVMDSGLKNYMDLQKLPDDEKRTIARICTNYFGMKKNLSGNTWSGSAWDQTTAISCWTWEEDSTGNRNYIKADFRAYASIEESIADHSAYLKNAMNGSRKRYPMVTVLTDYSSLTKHIADNGYASSKTYAQSLNKLITTYALDRYDSTYKTAAMPIPELLKPFLKEESAASDSSKSVIAWNSAWNLADKIKTVPKSVNIYTPKNCNGHTVFLNAGHGGNGKSLESKTPNDPFGDGKNQYSGSNGYTGGSYYVYGGQNIPESRWTNEIALLLKNKLLARGYAVVMARESDDESGYPYPENAARSVFANETSDIHVAIHFNSENTNPFWYHPDSVMSSQENYKNISVQSARLGNAIAQSLTDKLGFSSQGSVSGFLTGYAYSTIPIAYIEVMGKDNIPKYLSRKDEIAEAFAEGIDSYFNNR